MAIVMDPKTGDILAMGTYPGFDLNNPRGVATGDDPAILDSMTTAEKVTYWNKMWKNPLVNELYEPGSPFKLITTSAALEEGLTSTADTFQCAPITIYDVTLNCWKAPASHGTETLVQGVANSCNPVFITLATRLGLDRFYNYLDLFGISKNTGIDFPGEASSIIQTKADAGPVGLATMGYGQGIAVTPIQMITALSAIGNDGKMMKPRLVQALADSDGKITESFDPKVVRQVISTQTASEVASMMEGVVSGGTGSAAYIPGMRVGGKTGTAQKVENGMYTDQTYSSFFAMAPMDDPQVAVLFIVDSPQGVHYGSQTAGPGVKMILSDTLNYLAVQPKYTEEEMAAVASQSVSVPDFTGYLYEDAVEVLRKLGLTGMACPTGSSGFTVVDQYPKPGTMLYGGNTVCLYAQ
ncbi:MAG: PASTA domain-containing protein, partial [Clostridia bacterium]|nr:PASTA domain-containing protein [Clostridia bacterium]